MITVLTDAGIILTVNSGGRNHFSIDDDYDDDCNQDFGGVRLLYSNACRAALHCITTSNFMSS
jgi:hypothetical protein